jgi:hypothetical protein
MIAIPNLCKFIGIYFNCFQRQTLKLIYRIHCPLLHLMGWSLHASAADPIKWQAVITVYTNVISYRYHSNAEKCRCSLSKFKRIEIYSSCQSFSSTSASYVVSSKFCFHEKMAGLADGIPVQGHGTVLRKFWSKIYKQSNNCNCRHTIR